MQTIQLQQERCLNCGINVKNAKKIEVVELACTHQTILAKWLEQQPLEGRNICANCHNLIQKCENDENPPRKLGHVMVCVGCGVSTLKKRHSKSSREEDVQSLFPWCKLLKYPTLLCYACYLRLASHIQKITKVDIEVEYTETECTTECSTSLRTDVECAKTDAHFTEDNNRLILPGLKRVLCKGGHRKRKCLMPECHNDAQDGVSYTKRRLVLLQTDTLITRRACVCKDHANVNKWGFGCNKFSIGQVEDALSLCERPLPIIDFDRVHEMPDHICKYWTGLAVDEFQKLYKKLNVSTTQFHSLRNALAIHLLRQKTGDSLLRIANLFLMTVKGLSKQLMEIERCFKTCDGQQSN